jgi:hypothetical protein
MSLLFRSCVLAVVAAVPLTSSALAQAPVSIAATTDLKTRCAREIAFFDRYGSTRGEHDDGRRNHTRIGAEIDCDRGDYEKGIAAMEDLLRRKKFDVPSMPAVAASPAQARPEEPPISR